MLSTTGSEPTLVAYFIVIVAAGLISMARWRRWFERSSPRSFPDPPDDVDGWNSGRGPLTQGQPTAQPQTFTQDPAGNGVDSLSFADLQAGTTAWNSVPGALVNAQHDVEAQPGAGPPPPGDLPYDYQAGKFDPEPFMKRQGQRSVPASRKAYIAGATFFVVTLAYVMFGSQTKIGGRLLPYYGQFASVLALTVSVVGIWSWSRFFAAKRRGYW